MHLATMIRAGCLAACAAVASGLAMQRRSAHSVFFLGSSVDRYAVADFCETDGKKFYRLSCVNEERDLAVGYAAHPGVGIHGDFQPPFWNHTYPIVEHSDVSSSQELRKAIMGIMNMKGEEFPDMIVVESSLWDLFTWASWGVKNVTKERLHQWGRRDLKHLMARVSETFPQSRIVFRNAPRVHHSVFLEVILKDEFHKSTTVSYPDVAVVSVKAMDWMKHEVDKEMQNGKLYGLYEVVDYYKIMNELIEERGFVPSLWMKDGTHPSMVASRRYMNAILQLMQLPTVSQEDSGRREKTIFDDDSDDSVLFP